MTFEPFEPHFKVTNQIRARVNIGISIKFRKNCAISIDGDLWTFHIRATCRIRPTFWTFHFHAILEI